MGVMRALWGSTHPGPTMVVTALTAVLGLAGGLSATHLVLLAVSVWAGQVSIGLSNDAIDVARDRAVGRTDKPLARPGAPIRLAWAVCGGSVVVAIALSAAIGWRVAGVHAVLLAAGWAYNVGLKRTSWSVIGFVVAFGGLPSLVRLAGPDPGLAPLWATIAGALLGVAIHVSNVLPDFADDARTGVRGLPHRLGFRASAILAPGALTAGGLAVAIGADAPAGVGTAIRWIGFGLVLGLAVWSLTSTLRRGATRLGFRLVMAAAAVLVAQLAAMSALSG